MTPQSEEYSTVSDWRARRDLNPGFPVCLDLRLRRPTNISNIEKLLADFESFCLIDRQLSDRTVYGHVRHIKRFLNFLRKHPNHNIVQNIRNYLAKFRDMSPCTYANQLKSLKVFFRDFLGLEDLVRTFKFPQRPFKIKTVPSKNDLQEFYRSLKTTRDKALFMTYATSGRRETEVLSLQIEDVDFGKRMIAPNNGYINRTKRCWYSFFNEEAAEVLEKYLASRNDSDPRLFLLIRRKAIKIFQGASEDSRIKLRIKDLRDWFCCQMGELGVQDRYIDAFCGRVPKSILARHYTDYSPERLKRIYDRANLKVLS